MGIRILGAIALLGACALCGASAETGLSPSAAPARVVIEGLPPDARVYFDEKATRSPGAVRVYTTPPLDPGQRYFPYTVLIEILQGENIEPRIMQISVTPGSESRVSFSKAQPAPAPTNY